MQDRNVETVRRYYAAYEMKNRGVLERMLLDEFRFNSPLDDQIDKTTYMKKCWPNSEQIEAYHFETLVAAEPNKVFSRYTVDWKADRSFKFPCMECIELEGGKIKRIDCYFGFVPKDELSL